MVTMVAYKSMLQKTIKLNIRVALYLFSKKKKNYKTEYNDEGLKCSQRFLLLYSFVCFELKSFFLNATVQLKKVHLYTLLFVFLGACFLCHVENEDLVLVDRGSVS